jgi:hypothetical protein
MSQLLFFLGLGMMLVTLFIAGTGIVLMGLGNEANKKYGNRLMAYRVYAQGIAIALIALSFALA